MKFTSITVYAAALGLAHAWTSDDCDDMTSMPMVSSMPYTPESMSMPMSMSSSYEEECEDMTSMPMASSSMAYTSESMPMPTPTPMPMSSESGYMSMPCSSGYESMSMSMSSSMTTPYMTTTPTMTSTPMASMSMTSSMAASSSPVYNAANGVAPSNIGTTLGAVMAALGLFAL